MTSSDTPSLPRPPALARLRPMELDVREDIRRGEEPFARIMAAVGRLPDDGVLVLRAPFEPVPLYGILAKRGLAHWTEWVGPEDWRIWFYRGASAGRGATVIDVRGLEPPAPMVRVLERLETLGPGERLEVLHERRPMFLYPLLDARGFSHETEEPAPGLVRIVIQRPDETR